MEDKIGMLERAYKIWCSETKRNGGVIMGSSMKEFFVWYEKYRRDNRPKVHLTFMKSESSGYCAYFTNHPGVITQAETMEELIQKGEKLLRFWLVAHLDWLENGIETREVSESEFFKKK